MKRSGSGARQSVDWTELRRRLSAAAEHANGADSAGAADQILRERARQLMRPPAPETRADEFEAIAFTIGRERYALRSESVLAICGVARLTPVPGAAPPVAGVMAWRGEVLTVLDLRQLLSDPAAPLVRAGEVLVIGDARTSFGLMIDDRPELLQITTTTSPSHGPGRPYLSGVTGDGLLILDIAALIRRLTEGGNW
ncbi:MAG TPA: CheW domain-containing protein [Gemmatimonadales bacterium]|nr:CheW domain-containing protein [Gemmatimonadales bacterium]